MLKCTPKIENDTIYYEFIENLSENTLSKIDKIYLEFHEIHDRYKRIEVINKLMKNGFNMHVYDKKINFINDFLFSLFFTKK